MNIPVGGTLVPLIFLSDSTHLTNFAGDKKAWPVYMTIGNLRSSVRMKPTMHSVVLVALLPQPLKARDVPLAQKNKQKKQNRLIQQTVLDFLLQPLSNPVDSEFVALCSDDRRRSCHAVLSGWIADYPEHVFLQGCGYGLCPQCEVGRNELGQLQDTPPRQRDHCAYQRLHRTASAIEGVCDELDWENIIDDDPSDGNSSNDFGNVDAEPDRDADNSRRTSNRATARNTQVPAAPTAPPVAVNPAIYEEAQEAREELEARGMNCYSNILWRTRVVVSDLPKPDILHTMQLGMLKHLLEPLTHLLTSYDALAIRHA
jgi:hypothetical protein